MSHKEIERTDGAIIVDRLFPGGGDHPASSFFTDAARSIFARLLEFRPASEELAKWLVSEKEIDKRVEGTELAVLISPKAPQQRKAVLSTLSGAKSRLNLL